MDFTGLLAVAKRTARSAILTSMAMMIVSFRRILTPDERGGMPAMESCMDLYQTYCNFNITLLKKSLRCNILCSTICKLFLGIFYPALRTRKTCRNWSSREKAAQHLEDK